MGHAGSHQQGVQALRRARRLTVGLAALATATAFSALAHADDRAAAQLLFQQGREGMAAGRFAEACKKFEGAAQLSQTPGVRLNLSECYEKLGRTAAAYGKADEALALAERAGDAAAAAAARARLQDLTPRLSYLTLVVPERALIPGLTITRDHEAVPEAAWGVAVPVDPGEHTIRARAAGFVAWRTTTTVGERGKLTVTIPRLEPVDDPSAPSSSSTPGATSSAAPQGPAAGTPSPDSVEPPGQTQRTLGLIGMGAGLVGIGIGSYYGLDMLSKQADYEDRLGPKGQCLDASCLSANEEARSSGTLASVGWIAGGALAVAGAVLWFTAPSSDTPVSLAPVAGPRTAAVTLRGAW